MEPARDKDKGVMFGPPQVYAGRASKDIAKPEDAGAPLLWTDYN